MLQATPSITFERGSSSIDLCRSLLAPQLNICHTFLRNIYRRGLPQTEAALVEIVDGSYLARSPLSETNTYNSDTMGSRRFLGYFSDQINSKSFGRLIIFCKHLYIHHN